MFGGHWSEDDNKCVMETEGNKIRMLVMEETSVAKLVLYVRNMKNKVTHYSFIVDCNRAGNL